jgi:hypothetical protein
MTRAVGDALWLGGLALGTALTIWLFAANPQSPADLGSRLALGLSPDRFGAELYRASELLTRADRFFEMRDPSDRDAVAVQRELLEARGGFARAVERAGSPEEAVRARRGWAEADLRLARWALARGKGGGLLEGDDEDLFRWGLAYAREGLGLSDLDPAARAALDEIRERLERELSLWR